MASNTKAISLRDVRKSQGSFELTIDHIEIAEGESFGIIGPSGAGKSTLLRMLSGLDRPSSGEVSIFGEPVERQFGSNRVLRTVFQDLALFPHLTVEEQLTLSLRAVGRLGDAKTLVSSMVQHLGLSEQRNSKPQELSGGQKQRLALGRAVITRPKILLMDEPMTALDFGNRMELWKYIELLALEVGITFVVVTHDPDVAMLRSDRVAVLNKNRNEDRSRCIRVGTPRELYEDPRSAVVVELLGGANVVNLLGYCAEIDPAKIKLGIDTLSDVDYSFSGQLLKADNYGTSLDLQVLVEGEVLRIRRPSDGLDPIVNLVPKAVAFNRGAIRVGWNREAVRRLDEEPRNEAG